ncbi:MAG: cytochrome b/b6 domain-containing protein, partial [Bacteroidia bacterium]|nr:cytochrome b/b6 domain-containing protein [Bacteroidia bacterium]
SSAEASYSYWFGTVRFIHFMTAYIFTLNLIVRFYWAFKGNRFANWRVFFPWSKKSIEKIKHVFKVDVFLQSEEKEDLSFIAVGHNPLAAISYLALFALCIVQVFTGFALYAPNASWFFPKMFGFVTGIFGEEFMVRSIHHAITWLIVLFTLIHVYLVVYHDWLEGRGEASAMFGGYKFVRKERFNLKHLEPEDIEELTVEIEDVSPLGSETKELKESSQADV